MTLSVKGKIQKWGNGLGLRVSGPIRDIPQFANGTPIDIEIFEDGFTVRKAHRDNTNLIFSEAELLEGLGPETSQAELLVTPSDVEWGE